MKTIHHITILFMLMSITFIPLAFSQQVVNVTIEQGSSTNANAPCVTANNCFNPNPLNIAIGTTVIWQNNDTAGHTVTSGQPTDSQMGTIFGSGIIKPGGSFKFVFNTVGAYNYFCEVHPWMVGQVNLGVVGQPQIKITFVSNANPRWNESIYLSGTASNYQKSDYILVKWGDGTS